VARNQEGKKLMARFDLSSYSTVAERIDLFWARYPQGRIHTEIVHFENNQVIVRASVWTDREDEVPVTVDYAEESLAVGPMAKFGVETCATSAIGRALADLGNEFSGTKRPSREEMMKAQRHATRDWVAESDALTDVDALRLLWSEAKHSGADEATLDKVKQRAQRMESPTGVSEGSGSGVAGSH
jgi:hypothetical protein